MKQNFEEMYVFRKISFEEMYKNCITNIEEMKLQITPMDYEEFCDATSFNYSLLKQVYETGKAIGQDTNRKLMRDLRVYMAVGGMPQAGNCITGLYLLSGKDVGAEKTLKKKPLYMTPFIIS